ncbi:MAG: hypothetical protein ACLRRT_02465 [Ruthenibacterium lactatiformans]
MNCGFDVWLERATKNYTACTLGFPPGIARGMRWCWRRCAAHACAVLGGTVLPCRARQRVEVTVPRGLENAVVELRPE